MTRTAGAQLSLVKPAVIVERCHVESSSKGLSFGWLSPVIGNQWSDYKPIVQYQCEHILPTVTEHFDSLWIADHFYGFDQKSDPFLEAWTTLTWCAAKFPNVDLCHHVLGVGYRPPALTAKMASTLQFLSGNRFILGIGAGWREEEYLAYGYDFPAPSVRFRQLEEAINVCRLMWTEEDPHFEGEFFHIAGADAPPLPAMPPPICIGTSGEQIGIPLAARHADIWNTVWRGNLDSLTRKRDVMLQELERLGRDREEVQFSLTIERPLPQTASEVDDFGTMLTGLIELGMEHFVLDFGNPETADEADRFIADVMGPLRA